MILIGEAGGTKTEWRLFDDESVRSYSGPAFNAVSGDLDKLLEDLENLISGEAIQKVHFYAAGMLANQKVTHFPKFKTYFLNSEILLESDVLGAARALFGNKSGVVGILGTGSACCAYDGKELADRIPSLGYIMGDEGSGFDLGRRWIRSFLRKQTPYELTQKFKEDYPDFSESNLLEWTKEKLLIISKVSSITAFLKANEHHPFVRDLITKAFGNYFVDFSSTLSPGLSWGFTGSVAYYFREILQETAGFSQISIDRILPSAIDELVNYHKKNG